MALALVTVAAGLLVGVLRGGRVRHLAGAALVGSWLLVAAVAAQALVGLLDLPAGAAANRVLLGVSHAGLLGFCWRNRMLPGMPLVLLGIALNALVVTANGAMPVDPDAAARIGAVVEDRAAHRPLLPGDALRPLADVIAVPPLRAVVSAGDVVLAAGLGVLAANLLAPRGRPARAPADA